MSGYFRKDESKEPAPRLWWEGTESYWNDLPFYAELGLCAEVMDNRDDELAAREQLWAIRETDDEIQPMMPF